MRISVGGGDAGSLGSGTLNDIAEAPYGTMYACSMHCLERLFGDGGGGNRLTFWLCGTTVMPHVVLRIAVGWVW